MISSMMSWKIHKLRSILIVFILKSDFMDELLPKKVNFNKKCNFECAFFVENVFICYFWRIIILYAHSISCTSKSLIDTSG
jgi:hypothetical protein